MFAVPLCRSIHVLLFLVLCFKQRITVVVKTNILLQTKSYHYKSKDTCVVLQIATKAMFSRYATKSGKINKPFAIAITFLTSVVPIRRTTL